MGILNVTPDSFYALSRADGDIVERALRAEREGAEIIDIGGQSTRPSAAKVSASEELSRVLPALETVKKTVKIPVSVDTFYPEVARQVIAAGADMINDVSCLRFDGMAELIGESGVSVCVMHDRRNSAIADLFADKTAGLSEAVRRLTEAGVDKNKILLDGGIGFNKSNAEDWELLDNYDRLMRTLPYPFLLGTSRKSMFGGEVGDRLKATLDSTLKAAGFGVMFVRVHDVKENAAVIRNLK